MAIVTSPDVSGAYKISIKVFCIFPIINDEEECEKDCCIIDMLISPGVRNVIKEKPKTLLLSFPIARDRTSKNNKDVIKGENTVWIQTVKKRKTSFLYKENTPIQLTNPNFLTSIS